MTWQEDETAFVESDVISWVEAIWPPQRFNSRKRRSKPRPYGSQKVTAQIAEINGDFIKLTILKAEITENTIGSELKPHKIGTTITKKKTTLLRGQHQRLHWSEEDVRAALLNHPHPL